MKQGVYSIKRDKYRRVRGGYSRILDVSCEHCGCHLFFYQKDGPGILKRVYIDRMIPSKDVGKQLLCPECSRVVGMHSIFKKENRPCYRLFVGSVIKKVVKREDVLV